MSDTGRSLNMARNLIILFSILFYPGCMTVAPLVVSGVGSGATYSLFNTAYKTETYPLKNVYRACMQALKTMEIRVQKVSRDKKEITIEAQTAKRKVSIDLEPITRTTTKITINVSKSLILKDKSTAEEIIHQMILVLKNTRGHRLRKYASLAVSASPPEATIQILNIKPKFYQGIELKPGLYELLIKAKKYKNKKILTQLRPGQDKILPVSLKKK